MESELRSGSSGEFDWQPGTRVVFGPGVSGQTGELTAALGLRHVLLVTDSGLVRAGHPQRIRQSLQSAGVSVTLFDRVQHNPTGADVENCRRAAELAEVDGFVGLGGGSSIDTAKGANFVLTNGGAIEDYWGVGKAKNPLLPLIAIPTTAGTGTEMQSFALISRDTDHRKMACGDKKALARIAVLDPSLTLSQPRSVAAMTGIDALTHAIETAVTTKRTAISELFSAEAFARLAGNLERVLDEPTDLEARGAVLLGAAFAGHAIENSMLGAAHALANPLTAHFDVIHGHAVGMMLPHVIRYNARDPVIRDRYTQLALRAGRVDGSKAGRDAGVEALIELLERTLRVASLAGRLSTLGIPRERLPELASDAADQWTARFNPVSVGAEELRQLYESAY